MPPDSKPPIRITLPPPPIRSGDPVRTLPGSGDQLTGRVTAVFKSQIENGECQMYYRVRFPVPSPYFYDEGAVFRAHEIELAKPAATEPKSNLPKRPKPFQSQ